MNELVDINSDLADRYECLIKPKPLTTITPVASDITNKIFLMDSPEPSPLETALPSSSASTDETDDMGHVASDDDVDYVDYDEISLEDPLDIERQNPTPADALPSPELGIYESVPQTPILVSGPIPALEGYPPSPRPNARKIPSRARPKPELSAYEKEVALHRRRMKEREEEDIMISAGFRMEEALITSAELWLYRHKPFQEYRVNDPSPLRKCWVKGFEYDLDEFDLYAGLWEPWEVA
ncbi:uncharacterized protein BP5553_02705 [Venustampulla echinocandica]|uniref:Uncharacterized protein n=1 Tax=Venustampulla echinocandica TaxID=2656787 RepID=A0A370TS53_9HELO|nr:uncharacterized protein BP5553_02705 [Venustampulla echinocandica]RDL38365.1 hypothetical protein BP5553_02705 [Venustampulla echinocandica]